MFVCGLCATQAAHPYPDASPPSNAGRCVPSLLLATQLHCSSNPRLCCIVVLLCATWRVWDVTLVVLLGCCAGRDVVGLSDTGSGKTLAFVLPLVCRLWQQPPLAPGTGTQQPDNPEAMQTTCTLDDSLSMTALPRVHARVHRPLSAFSTTSTEAHAGHSPRHSPPHALTCTHTHPST